MSIDTEKKITDISVIWRLLGCLATGFIAGWGAHKVILETGNQISIQKDSFVTKDILAEKYMLKADCRDYQTAGNPTITLSDDITDERGAPVEKKKAPFKVQVRGAAKSVKGFYTYLVVNDFNVLWIQPSSSQGVNVSDDFSGYCHLGKVGDPNSLNKRYEVFAVVTNREYKDYDHLDVKTVKARSNAIEFFRTR